jgi:hypothetical protein
MKNILNPVIIKESKKIDDLLYDIWLNRLSRGNEALNTLIRRLDSHLGYTVTNTLKNKCSDLGIELIDGYLMNKQLKQTYNKLVISNTDKIIIEHLLGGIKERIKYIKNTQWSNAEVEGTKQIREYLLNYNFAIHRENRYKKELNEKTLIEQIMNFL